MNFSGSLIWAVGFKFLLDTKFTTLLGAHKTFQPFYGQSFHIQ